MACKRVLKSDVNNLLCQYLYLILHYSINTSSFNSFYQNILLYSLAKRFRSLNNVRIIRSLDVLVHELFLCCLYTDLIHIISPRHNMRVPHEERVETSRFAYLTDSQRMLQ